MSRVLANGPKDRGSIPKTQKRWYLIPPQFNPSADKVAPDAPVIYTDAVLLLTPWLGRRSICNTIPKTQKRWYLIPPC